jgi:mxaD protein
MKRLIAASFAIALLNPLAVFADQAKTLKVKESVEINAKADDVWAKANNFGDLGAWHPAVKKTEILEGENNKKGAVRLLTLQDGGTIKEKLKAYNAKKMSFTYEIIEGVLPVSHYVSTVSVKAGKDGKTTVVWEGSFKRKDTSAAPAKGQGDEDASNTITGVYKGGLENLKKISEAK